MKKFVALATAAALMTAAAPAYSHPLPPPPIGPSMAGNSPLPSGVIGAIACVGGIVVAALYVDVVYGKELAGPGFCGLGATPATCESITLYKAYQTPQVYAANRAKYCKSPAKHPVVLKVRG